MNFYIKTGLVCLFMFIFSLPLISQSARIPADSLLIEVRMKNGETAKGRVIEQLPGPRAVFKSSEGRLFVISKDNTEEFELDREKLAELNRNYREVEAEAVKAEDNPVAAKGLIHVNGPVNESSLNDPEIYEGWLSKFSNPYWGFGFRYKLEGFYNSYYRYANYDYDNFGYYYNEGPKFSFEYLFGSDFPVTGFTIFDFNKTYSSKKLDQTTWFITENLPDQNSDLNFSEIVQNISESSFTFGVGITWHTKIEVGDQLSKPYISIFGAKRFTSIKSENSKYPVPENPSSGLSSNYDKANSDINSPWIVGAEFGAEYYFSPGLSLVAGHQIGYYSAEATFEKTQWIRTLVYDPQTSAYILEKYFISTREKVEERSWNSKTHIGLNFYF